MSLRLTIDGQTVEAAPGETLLVAARRLGIDIPTLCHHEKCAPATSCLVCLVRVHRNGLSKLVPSCATRAEAGMVVESETSEVHDARRTALELLFSDHVGDCLAPCNRLCPLDLNIPAMLRQVENGDLSQAIETVRHALPLPAVLGFLCHSPCEQGCRRGSADQAAAIRDLERFVAGRDRDSKARHLPPRLAATGKAVAVVGAGPSGLSAAYFLLRAGFRVTLLDRHERAGGSLRTAVEDGRLPREILEDEVAQLRALGASLETSSELGRDFTLDELERDYDAVLLAVGTSAKQQATTLGLEATASGLQVNAPTGKTAREKVFAVGSAVRPLSQVVKAMAAGRDVAEVIGSFLRSEPLQRPGKPFSSLMGRLAPDELKLFLRGPSLEPRHSPALDLLHGFTPDQAKSESARCLHCDCRSVGHCELQRYAELYGADASRFRQERRPFEQDLRHGEVIFEPGKCILCGICVQLAEQAGESLGLTFIGRGFDVRVGVPFNGAIDDGLRKVGRECVEACPTGALAFKNEVAPPATRA